ncbi:MAG: hypothetical protein A2275_13450 [Bacteroidetes bacterium RIFOXYA12_FULL_35_11]|nr:MAG: hypothetical protein A2X01_20395 [Bacteroidetes bacterium GWF2_35_48]OFY81673.1 MAG: hypothetical protein A2275_13450 [Bacteroidetes bacterium RIFOXYA12_FULL_35_11]OFY96376.1 MAG: hypothetical protein A2309_01950 [Bacteroidetes bacterium RIFOXYB2_FULL_35_7]OFZ04953.1 MAG: hypothetical protein A2491_17345 [Bacteroidetes bacterium RIFOXYC12_FULL_35_7]HBX50247.1 hypothetical protein [Bacteroidales bacterium]
MKYIAVIIFIILYISAFSQDKKEHVDILARLQIKEAGKGNIKIRQDSSIIRLLNKYMDYCDNAKGDPGYRIRIFSNSGNNAREQANSCKSKFETAHPDHSAYLQYKSPDFEVVIGDFRTKSEALKLLKTIQSEYPSAFIIKTLIGFPQL